MSTKSRKRKQFELTYYFGEKQWVRELDDEAYIEKITRESQKVISNKEALACGYERINNKND